MSFGLTPLMVSLSNRMSGAPFGGPLTPFDMLRVSGRNAYTAA